MADTPTTPSSAPAPVIDRRTPPRGGVPRRMQTWILAGVAAGMLLIIFVAGQPEPRPRATATTVQQPAAPDANRLRDYQDRLRVLETQQVQVAQDGQPVVGLQPMPPAIEGTAAASEDPIVTERKRRDYESLFASNVVLSRRPDGQRLDGTQPVGALARGGSTAGPTAQSGTSIDEIADAVVRATARANPSAPGRPGEPAQTGPTGLATPTGSPASVALDATPGRAAVAPGQSGRILDEGPVRRLLEGTVIDTVLANRLDGGSAAPVNCLVTNPVYSHSGRDIVIPAGARVLGTTRPVQALGETRLAVAFHRLIMPDGSTFSLDRMPGLNQRGDAALRDRVDQHYLSTFGAAAAVGLIGGLAQLVGTAGFGDRNGTVVIAGSAVNDTAQASAQVMNRFLNRLPTVTIREGHRVKVYLTSDVDLPPYGSAQ